jgi:hypothetical protein
MRASLHLILVMVRKGDKPTDLEWGMYTGLVVFGIGIFFATLRLVQGCILKGVLLSWLGDGGFSLSFL